MTPELADGLQWLKDCGGTMALSNNPMSNQLIQEGLAKKGGYDSMGRRTLVLIGSLDPTPPPGGLSDKARDFFRNRPKGKTAVYVQDRVAEVFSTARGLGKMAKAERPATHTGFGRAVEVGIAEIGSEGGFVVVPVVNKADFESAFGVLRTSWMEPMEDNAYQVSGFHCVLFSKWVVLFAQAPPYSFWFYDEGVTKALQLNLV